MLIRYSEQNRSVEQFVNYIAMRYKKGELLTVEERLDLYDNYVTFCEIHNMNYYHRLTFYRQIRTYGFKADQVWVKEQRKTKMAYYLPDDSIEAILKTARGIDLSKHIAYVIISGARYRVTTTYEKVGDAVFLEETQNPDPTGE